jgi:hypothetical protein
VRIFIVFFRLGSSPTGLLRQISLKSRATTVVAGDKNGLDQRPLGDNTNGHLTSLSFKGMCAAFRFYADNSLLRHFVIRATMRLPSFNTTHKLTTYLQGIAETC